MRPRLGSHDIVAIDIANVHVGLWSSSHISVACSLAIVCRIVNLLLLARQRFLAGVGGARVKCVGKLILKIKKCTNKPVKRFQMKSNGCRDV